MNHWLMRSIILLLISITAYAKPFIHPDMEAAIHENESLQKRGIKPQGWLNPKRPTGFHPTSNFYKGGTFLQHQADPTPVPTEFDMRTKSYSPVRGQIQGSCWAEGNVSAFEMTWNFIKGTKLVFGVNDVIDCSGYGSAWSGGQLSMQYDTKAGLALESVYPYTGRDGRCKKDVARSNQLRAAPFLRGANGGFPSEPELKAAIFKYGAMEVCGASSSLGSGGRQDTPRSGRVDHCYAVVGWLDGKAKGWLAASY